MNTLSQQPFISTDPETNGFDLSAGLKWIYPKNCPRRDYQFTIVQTALYNNTLVCLPTGLGKTFIAAVVMFNFWRWYPRGRVVFLAPTKPLVAQQIEACHGIMGIASDQTIELTGAINQNKRREAWLKKRVIFATPQTFQKDLENDCVPCELIKCIVIDEAHKALGKHSYSEIVHLVSKKTKFFRVLALSATPGSKADHVKEVIQNLLISKLELRDDSSPDITPYTNIRLLEKVIVTLDKDLKDYKDRYINIMDPHVKVLIKSQLLQSNTASISKGRIFLLMKQYESRPQKAQNHGVIMKTLNILLTMYHAYDLLINHGLRAFYNFYSNHSDKFWLEAELDLQLLLKEIKLYIGDFPVIQALHDEHIPDIPKNLIFGHSKFSKLHELLMEHFQSFSKQNKSTRAIVFVEYRDIVNEVYVLLLQARPLIRPKMFVGQAGQKRKQQLAVLDDFKNNKVNVLISTSVGEEGLDVGEVDLIICFDISSSTPTRLVQRMGRTGRKRNGRVVLLLTEGKEVQTLLQALSKRDTLNSKVLKSDAITCSLYQLSPRMIPLHLTPECLPIFIKPQLKSPKNKDKKTKVLEEKRTRKKKQDVLFKTFNFVTQLSRSKPDEKPSITQSSMIQFLTDQRQQKIQPLNFYDDIDYGKFSDEFQNINRKSNIQENPYTVIKPSEVELFISDNHAVEFLTLCTMKKSEKVSCDFNIIKIIEMWIPINSPVDIFSNFTLPSVDTFDFIKNLNFYEKPFEIEQNLDISGCYYPNNNDDNCVNNRISNYLCNISAIESKYIQNSESMDSELRGAIETDFEKLATECIDSDFFESDFTCFDPKYYLLSKSMKGGSKKRDKSPPFDKNIFPFKKVKKLQHLSQETTERTPGQVEVDFENILNEYTESETSESVTLIENRFELPNIFDDLLNQSSSDEELFDYSREQQNSTVVISKQNDETHVNSQKLSLKRSANTSPCYESAVKIQRVYEPNSIDEDCAFILGTPPKSKGNKSFTICNEETDTFYSNSDEDIFDDLDFDRQYSISNKSDTLLSKSKKNYLDFIKKKDNDKYSEKYESFDNENNKVLFEIEKEKKKNVVIEENISSSHILKFKDSNIVKSETLLKNAAVESEKAVNFQLSRGSKDKPSSPKKISTHLNDFQFDDWDDDINVSMTSTTALKVQNTVGNNFVRRPISIKSSSQSVSSSRWISLDNTKYTKTFLPKTKFACKNLNTIQLNVTLNPSTEKKSDSIENIPRSNQNSNLFEKSNVDHKLLSVNTLKSSDLHLLSLKKNFNKSVKECKVLLSSAETLTLSTSSIQKKAYKDKENILPKWKCKKKNDCDINPRFRKYNESNFSCRNKTNKVKERKANNFINDQAEVSTDVDTTEGSSADEDGDLENFVSYSQNISDAVDMKAFYLQSMSKSPIKSGAFMFKDVKKVILDCDLYSQPVSEVNDTYLYDSFCVGDETQIDDHNSNSLSNDSTLENIELENTNRDRSRRNKKQSKSKKIENLKGRNITYVVTDSSSEDETEILRKQILEESMLLKQ